MKKLFLVPMACLLLAACSSEDDTEKKVDKANDRIKSLNKISKELNDEYGVNIAPAYASIIYAPSSSDYAAKINKRAKADCKKGKKLLENYISKGNKVLNVADSDSVIFTQENDLERYISNAEDVLQYVDCTLNDGVNWDFDFDEAERTLEEEAQVEFRRDYINSTISLDTPKDYQYTKDNLNTSIRAAKTFVRTVEKNTTKSSRSDLDNKKLKLVKSKIQVFEAQYFTVSINEEFVSHLKTMEDLDQMRLIEKRNLLSKMNSSLDFYNKEKLNHSASMTNKLIRINEVQAEKLKEAIAELEDFIANDPENMDVPTDTDTEVEINTISEEIETL